MTDATSQPRSGTAGPYRLLAFDQLGSTNEEAMARLRAGDPGGVFVVARSQNKGRGRQGRAWISPAGNLYASLGLRLDVAPTIAPQLGFVAGVALATVLRERLAGDTRLRIKWPNDIVFAGAKLAGLLLESTLVEAGRTACVVGFGVNCRSSPEDMPYPATSLAAIGDPDPNAEPLVEALAIEMERRLALWHTGTHFEAIRQDWLSLAVDLGTPLAVAFPTHRVAGIFGGIDARGRLLLDAGGGRIEVDAGDVFLPGTAVKNEIKAPR